MKNCCTLGIICLVLSIRFGIDDVPVGFARFFLARLDAQFRNHKIRLGVKRQQSDAVMPPWISILSNLLHGHFVRLSFGNSFVLLLWRRGEVDRALTNSVCKKSRESKKNEREEKQPTHTYIYTEIVHIRRIALAHLGVAAKSLTKSETQIERQRRREEQAREPFGQLWWTNDERPAGIWNGKVGYYTGVSNIVEIPV